MAEQMGTLDTAETCNRCGGENVRWSAPSPLWNKVMRGNDINGEPLYDDLTCIRCFIVLALEAGVDGTWRVTVTPQPDDLVLVTPSGRMWDADRWLWVDWSRPCLDCGPGYRVGDDGCRHGDYHASVGETGVCRTCAQPIWWETGEVGHREFLGWSDRITRGGDSLVCFKAVGYRHVPMGDREAAIYKAGLTAGRDGEGSHS